MTTSQIIEIPSSLEEIAEIITNLPDDAKQEFMELLNDDPADSGALVAPPETSSEVVPLDEEKPDTSEELAFADSEKFRNFQEASASTVVRRKSYNHRGKDWNPLTERGSVDAFAFSIPDGYEFSHHEITPLNVSFPSQLEVASAPAKGTTGKGTIKTQWKLWGLGQVNYQVSAYCHKKGSAPGVQVVIGSRGWETRAAQLIAQKQHFKLILTGPDAGRLWNDALKFFTGGRNTEIEPVITITIAIVAGVVALAGFATIAFVLTQAINKGCDAKANYTPGQGVAGTLVFDINGCNK